MNNYLEELLKLFPDNSNTGSNTNNWNYFYLSENPNISINIVNSFLLKRWNWYDLAKNIDWYDIINNPYIPWCFRSISQNDSITLDIIKSNPTFPTEEMTYPPINYNRGHFRWFWDLICRNPKIITWDILQNNPEIKLDIKGLSKNPSITCDIIQSNTHLDWCWESLSSNPNLTTEFIKKNIDKAWDWNELNKHPAIIPIIRYKKIRKHYLRPFYLSWNPSLTIDIIKSFPKLLKTWDWYEISAHKNMTWEIICENSNLPWNWSSVSANPNVTWEIIKANPDKKWDYYDMTHNPNVTIDIILNNIYKSSTELNNWDWEYLSSSSSVTWEIIESYPNIKWNWKCVSKNPNIIPDNIKNNLDIPWDFKELSKNTFLKDNIALKNHLQKYKAKRIIIRIYKSDFRLYDDIVDLIYLYI
jgi:hypothetical protein